VITYTNKLKGKETLTNNNLKDTEEMQKREMRLRRKEKELVEERENVEIPKIPAHLPASTRLKRVAMQHPDSGTACGGCAGRWESLRSRITSGGSTRCLIIKRRWNADEANCPIIQVI